MRYSAVATRVRNDFRKIGYGGPCPPPGEPYRRQQAGPGEGHARSRLAKAERMGTYGRRLEAVREHLWMFLWETGKKFASHLLSSDDSKGCISGFDP